MLRNYCTQKAWPSIYVFIYSCSLYFVALGPSRARALLQLQTCPKTKPSKTCHAIAPLSQCCHLFSVCYYCEVHMEKAAKKRERERKRRESTESSQTQCKRNQLSAKLFYTRCAVSFSKPNANKQMFVFLYVQQQQSTAERARAS